MKYLAIVFVLALVGCSKQVDVVEAPAAPSTCSDAGDGLYDCHLQDGTRCVVFAGYKSGGLHCDFRATEVESHEH